VTVAVCHAEVSLEVHLHLLRIAGIGPYSMAHPSPTGMSDRWGLPVDPFEIVKDRHESFRMFV
jgi:hypothetical protein